MKFAEWAKAWVALAGLIANGLIAEATFLPEPWLYGVRVVAIVATAFAVWRVPNADPVPPAPTAPAPVPMRLRQRRLVEPTEFRLAA